MATRKRYSQNQPAKAASSFGNEVKAIRDLVYIGNRWSEEEDNYILYPTLQHGHLANKWYWGAEFMENYDFIVPTGLPLTAISLLEATSIATSIALSRLDLSGANVSLLRSDVVLIDDKKYLWCDMSKLVVVVPYRDPLVVIPKTGRGIWGTKRAVLIDEQKEYWEGGKWEGCYWFMREWGESWKPEEIEEITETASGILEIVELKHSEMNITNDIYDWYRALLGVKNVFFPLLAMSPFALYRTNDRRYIVTLSVPNQKRFTRVIVPSTYCTPRKPGV